MPASFTLTGTGEFYPSGTTVAVYPRATMLPDRAPSGSSVTSAVAGASSVAFSGLAFETQYAAYALVAGQHRYKTFKTDVAPLSLGLVWQGAWSAGTPYVVNDAVTYGGQSFRRKAAGTTATAPDLDATNWELIAAKGSDGSGALGVDVWASQANPAAVTDWGPIVNALIAANNRLLNFSAHVFPFSTQITNQGKQNVIFQGAGGWLHPWFRGQGGGPDRPQTQLVWKGGAGSGNAIVLDLDGHQLRDLAVLYDTGAYDGTLLRFSSATFQCARCAVDNCYIGSLGNGIGFTTATGVDVTNGVGIVIERSLFNGLKVGYFCRAGAVLSDDMIVHDVTFQCCSDAFVKNLPRSGSFKNIVLYGQAFVGTGTQPDDWIKGDASNTIASPSYCSFENIWCWDQQTPSSGTYVRLFNQPSNQDWKLTVKNVFSFSKQRILLNGPGTVNLEDIALSGTWVVGDPAPVDLGNFATALKTSVRIKNLPGAFNSGAPLPVANIAGHQHVDIDLGNGYPGVQTLSGCRRVSYDHENSVAYPFAVPTIAINAAATHLADVGIAVVDGVHWIEITADGTGQAAGLLADVTFATTQTSPDKSGTANVSSNGSMRVSIPLIGCSPFELSGYQTPGESWKAGLYVRVTAGVINGYKVCCANAIPAGVRLGLACWVIQV